MIDFKEVSENIANSERLLIGFGEAMKNATEEDLNKLKSVIEGKNYFILHMEDENGLYNKCFDSERIAPALEIDVEGEQNEAAKRYTKWLSMTLNKRIVIIELGASFINPAALRWPFERITFLNQKALFYRVNSKLPQVAEEVADKSVPVLMKPEEFIDKL